LKIENINIPFPNPAQNIKPCTLYYKLDSSVHAPQAHQKNSRLQFRTYGYHLAHCEYEVLMPDTLPPNRKALPPIISTNLTFAVGAQKSLPTASSETYSDTQENPYLNFRP
jgi:hypothetical protein